MFYRLRRLALVLLVIGTLYSCSKMPTPRRVAVLRFENLRPGQDTDWIGRAISEEVSGQLEGTRHNAIIPLATLRLLNSALGARPVAAPGISAERPAALAGGANHLITGFYSARGNQLRITAVDEDVETRQETAPLTVAGTVDDILHLTDEMARNIDDEATPPITGSARALRSYAIGEDQPTAQAIPLFQEAAQLDPDFGKPYVALARIALAAKDTDQFGRIFEAVRARGNGVKAVDRAVLNLEDARLHATLPTRIDALGALVRLMPADPFRLQDLGTAELEGNRYAEAADHFRKLESLLPNSTDTLNLLGYALMYEGVESEARKTFEKYRKADPSSANAFDSSGDAEFFFGHFHEAEQFYMQAHGINPGLGSGGVLLKAVWAKLMQNDRGGAAALLKQYGKERRDSHDPLAMFRTAQVLRVMSSHDEANKIVETYASAGPESFRPTATAQLRWWLYLDGQAAAPDLTSATAQPLLAIAKKNYQAAVPLWRKLAEEAPPTEWWTRTVYARMLLATGQTQEGARYLRFTPPAQPNRSLSFDELWYPWILTARTHAKGSVE